MHGYNRVPNPKHSRTDKPEIPLVSINAIDENGRTSGSIGRRYKCGSSGKEGTQIWVEKNGNVKYISEKRFNTVIQTLWNEA
jgi:hypothetical protein